MKSSIGMVNPRSIVRYDEFPNVTQEDGSTDNEEGSSERRVEPMKIIADSSS